MRTKDERRKQRRVALKERKQKEKEVKRQEIERLKALKYKEIEAKIDKIKEASGNQDIDLGVSVYCICVFHNNFIFLTEVGFYNHLRRHYLPPSAKATQQCGFHKNCVLKDCFPFVIPILHKDKGSVVLVNLCIILVEKILKL